MKKPSPPQSDANDISEAELELLRNAERPSSADTDAIKKMTLDSTGEEDEGTPLDMGTELDVPGAELDDDNEAIGEEDEENNAYSLPD